MAAPRCTLAISGPWLPGPQRDLQSPGSGFDEVVLLADDPRELLPLGLTTVAPLGSFPLGAIRAALAVARCELVLVVDLATVRGASELIEELATRDDDTDVVLARRGQLVPGRYRRGCARALRRARLTPDDALRGLGVTCLRAAGG